MKKTILILLILFASISTYSQSLNNLTVRNNFTLGDSIVNKITGGNTLATQEYVDSNAFVQPLDSIVFNENVAANQQYEYKVYADSVVKLLSYFRPGQTNRDFLNVARYVPFTNNTADTIPILTPISGTGIDLTRLIITGAGTNINDRTSSELFVGITEDAVPPGQVGMAAIFEFINNVNASSFSVGDALYVCEDTTLTNVRPMAPLNPIFVGTVFVSDAVNGVIGVNTANFTDSDTEVNLDGVINGIITQKQAVRDTIISNVLYFETYNEEETTRNLPFMYNSERYYLNTTTNTGTNGYARVALTYGTTTSAQTNYIYIDYNSGNPQLAVSTTAFPDDGVRLAQCNVYDQATHENYSFASFQRFNNAVDGSTTDGWVSKAAKRIRQEGSKYESGVDPTVTITADATVVDTVEITTTSGIIWQFNRQPFNSTTGGKYLWLNSPTGERWVGHLGEIDSTEAGIDLHGGINRRYGLNIFGIQNSGGFIDHIAVTTPTDYYSTDDNAINDVNGYAVTNVPAKYGKTAVRLFRIVLNYSTASSGTITNLLGVNGYQDERGFVLGTGGSGGGATGAQTNYSDSEFTIFNSVDPTKIANFDASEITTGTTRTFDFPDKSGELAIIENGVLTTDTLITNERIGIGTTNPQSALHLNKGFGLNNGILLGADNTGIYPSSSSTLRVYLAGFDTWQLTSSILGTQNNFGSAFRNVSVTGTVAGILPQSRDVNTGLGANDLDQLSGIAGGKEIWRAVENVTEQFGLNPQGDYTGTLANPSLYISDTHTGWYKPSVSYLDLVMNSTRLIRYSQDSTYHDSIAVFNSGLKTHDALVLTGGTNDVILNASGNNFEIGLGGANATWQIQPGYITNQANTGGWIKNGTPTGTGATIGPSFSDLTSGLGQNASGEVSLVANSTEGARITEITTFIKNNLQTEGGLIHNFTNVNAATYDLLTSDYILGVSYTSTGAVTSLTLPTAQTDEGRVIIIKDTGGNAGTNNITIDTEGSETIDGSATKVLNANYERVMLFSDGSNWFIIN